MIVNFPSSKLLISLKEYNNYQNYTIYGDNKKHVGCYWGQYYNEISDKYELLFRIQDSKYKYCIAECVLKNVSEGVVLKLEVVYYTNKIEFLKERSS